MDWRHVKFIEQFSADRSQARWLMMSDVCKHCVNAPCLEVCPTGSIVRTEFDTVYIQEPVCNGCRDCITACPFGVIHVSAEKHIAQKCTFCYDRLQNNLVPACAQACPTQSIQFGPIAELQAAGRASASSQLHGQGASEAYLYGADTKILGGLNAFYLLMDPPETYGLPSEVKAAGAQPVGLAGVAQGDRRVADHRLRRLRRRSAGGSSRWPRPKGRGARRMNLELNTSVADPGWHGLIVWYFFLGGIAAGAYVMAALADLFGDADDRPGVRVAVLPGLPAGGRLRALLTIDLGRPERFWHMLIQSNTGRPMFKWWSPMSVGSWGLSAFGLFSFASFVGVLAEDGWLGLKRFSPLAARLRTGWTGRLFALGGSLSAFFLGSYTGRPARGEQSAGLVEHDLDRGAASSPRRPRPASPPWSCSIAGCGSRSTNR